MKSRKIAC